MLFSCQGYLIANDQSKHDVSLYVSPLGLTIKMTSTDSQIAFIPRGTIDSVLTWFRSINEINKTGTLDLESMDCNIKVTIDIELCNLQNLERLLRGKVLFKRRPCFKRINGIAHNIFLLQIEGTNNYMVEKMAYFPHVSQDTSNLTRFEQIKQEQMILNNLKDHPHPNIIQFEEISCDDNSISILLEYCLGGDLLKFLNQNNNDINHQLVMKKLLNGIIVLVQNFCPVGIYKIKVFNITFYYQHQESLLKTQSKRSHFDFSPYQIIFQFILCMMKEIAFWLKTKSTLQQVESNLHGISQSELRQIQIVASNSMNAVCLTKLESTFLSLIDFQPLPSKDRNNILVDMVQDSPQIIFLVQWNNVHEFLTLSSCP